MTCSRKAATIKKNVVLFGLEFSKICSPFQNIISFGQLRLVVCELLNMIYWYKPALAAVIFLVICVEVQVPNNVTRSSTVTFNRNT